jgi:hypothetical protein
MTLYISVRRKIVVNNNKLNQNDPPWEVRTERDATNPKRVYDATYTGTIRIVYDAANPLASGAVCWLEVDESAPSG